MGKEKTPEEEEIINLKKGFVEKIKKYVLENFEPSADPRAAGNEFMSTAELYYNMQRLFPSKVYKTDDIALWLDQAGFTFIDMGCMNFQWILKRKK